MSKSLGNGIDPLRVVEMFGADAMRYTLVSAAALGTDLQLDHEDLESSFRVGRNFANKIWNVARFALGYLTSDDVARDPRDVFMSMLNHLRNFNPEAQAIFAREMREAGVAKPEIPDDPNGFFRDWLSNGSFEWENDGAPYWSVFRHSSIWAMTWFENELLMTKLGCPVAQPRFTSRPSARR